jgi:chromosomal replication initiation ATPase DnaA
MLTETLDVVKWLQQVNPNGEFHLSDGIWFISDGIESREITPEEICAMYHDGLKPDKKVLPHIQQLLQEMAGIWGVSVEWVTECRRSSDRPVMRAIFWLIAKKRFPKASRRQLGEMAGVLDHTTVRKGLRNIDRWLSISDPTVMRYYQPVAHLEAVDLATA